MTKLQIDFTVEEGQEARTLTVAVDPAQFAVVQEKYPALADLVSIMMSMAQAFVHTRTSEEDRVYLEERFHNFKTGELDITVEGERPKK